MNFDKFHSLDPHQNEKVIFIFQKILEKPNDLYLLHKFD